MEGWKEYRLGEIADIQTGPFGSQLHQSDYVDDGIPCIMPTNIGKHLDFLDENIAHISAEDANRLSKHIVTQGDIVYARRGDIEKCAYVSAKEEGWFCGTGCLRIRVKEEGNSHFIAYQLSTEECKKWIVGNAVGTTMLNLNTAILNDLPLYLPDKETQKQIVSILSSLDDKIENNRRINENLEQQAQALFKSWFVDFEPFRDGEFVESELGMIPKGWRVGTLSEIGEIIGGSTPSKAKQEYYTEKGIAWLTPKDLSVSKDKFTSRGEIDITELGYKSCSAKLMPRGTVLFSSRAPIGYISIAKNDICTNQGFKSVVPKVAGTAFIYYYLKFTTKDIENKATGSTFKEASGSLMKSLPLVISPKSVYEQFESLVEPIFNKQEKLEAESRRLTELRDALLPKLMSGELKVGDKV